MRLSGRRPRLDNRGTRVCQGLVLVAGDCWLATGEFGRLRAMTMATCSSARTNERQPGCRMERSRYRKSSLPHCPVSSQESKVLISLHAHCSNREVGVADVEQRRMR